MEVLPRDIGLAEKSLKLFQRTKVWSRERFSHGNMEK